MKRSGPIPRRTPLRQVGARKLRTLEAERSFRMQVRVNAGNWCQLQTPACLPYRHEGHHAHHIAPSDRDRGNHDPVRGLWTCFPGHAWIHRHPAESYERGWLIRDGGAA
jgi:hypothetical protein